MNWLPTFNCPTCDVPIVAQPRQSTRCPRCQWSVEWRGSIYRAMHAQRAAALAPFLHQYHRVREREGYGPHAVDYYRALPDVPLEDPLASTWHIRRRSYDTLCRVLTRVFGRRGLRVADLGAGNGWLSHRLASLGHTPVAIDATDDEDDGLGACARYAHDVVRVQADFDALPFAPAQFDVAVFNGALHHAPAPARSLTAAVRLLVAGGAVIVMDSPLFSSDLDGLAMTGRQDDHFRRDHGVQHSVRAGAGYLTFEALTTSATALGLRASFHRTRGPMRWEAGRWWAQLRQGIAPARFGVWVAQW